jgi:excisionase family DNA binding protein
MESTHRAGGVGRLLSLAEVCDTLGISRQLVYRLISAGDLPVVKLGDRTLVRPDDVDALVTRSTRRRELHA